MDLMLEVLRLAAAIVIAFLAGKLISRLHLPAILGWLIAGMFIGPHAFNILSNEVLDSQWFSVAESLFECIFGIMIGTELIWKDMKKAGSQIVVTTITESFGTLLVVSLVFGIIFWLSDVPIYLAFIFGGISLATAPAPSLSVVRDMKADGPVTRT
ncbi:MAG: cation:proton antiporter, partial [Lachnospiraceae bacterium]|nr:cation:proton antiporter [Lachnospiraceae bacterium]